MIQDINLVKLCAKILLPVSFALMVTSIAVRIVLCKYLALVKLLK